MSLLVHRISRAVARALLIPGLLVLALPGPGARADDAAPAPAPAGSTKSLSRTEEPIVVSGSLLTRLAGWSVRRIGVFALQQGHLSPIPFQMDEKTSKGEWALANGEDAIPDDDDLEVAIGGGKTNRDDAKNARKVGGPILDQSDEIVFMTGDTGDRAPKRLWPEGWKVGSEVQVEDPAARGGTGWAYVLGFDADAPRSALDYVRYDSAEQRVFTQDFALGFSKKIPIAWDYLVMSGGKDGEYQENRLDRLKIRAGATMLFGGIQIVRNEEDFESELRGWTDGAVRVIRQVENSVNLILGIQSPSGLFESIYYRNCIVVPTTIKLPFKPSYFFTDVILRGGVDFRDLKGWKAITSRNREPVEIDGKMSDAEKAWDRGDTDWVVFYKGSLAFMSRLIVDGGLKISRDIHYVDDENETDPPEFFPGQVPELLFDLKGWVDVSSGTHQFHTINYAIRNYNPGDELVYVDIVSHPSRITIGKDED